MRFKEMEPIGHLQIILARQIADKMLAGLSTDPKVAVLTQEQRDNGKVMLKTVHKMLDFAEGCEVEELAVMTSNFALLFLLNPVFSENLLYGLLKSMNKHMPDAVIAHLAAVLGEKD